MTKDNVNEALHFCRKTTAGFKEKAAHNKNEALWTFWFTIVASLAVPLFVTLGSGVCWGKAVPAVLSALAAFGSTWLQIRKPQQLWALYRTCQRELEFNENRYVYRIGEYAESDDPEKLLATHVSDIALNAHHKWLPLVPSPESLADIPSKASPVRKLDDR